MLNPEQRCINVKLAVDLITDPTDHPYCLAGSVLDRRTPFGHLGMIDAYTKALGYCFVRQRYFLDRPHDGHHRAASSLASLFLTIIKQVTAVLLKEWKKRFAASYAAINWEKFCTDSIMEMNRVTMPSSGSTPAAMPDSQNEQATSKDDLETHQLAASRYLDEAFSAFCCLCNKHLAEMAGSLNQARVTEGIAQEKAAAEVKVMLKKTLSFDSARIICLIFRDLCELEELTNKLYLAKQVMAGEDPCHLVEYERHIHGLFIARLSAYARLQVRYNSDTRVRDWSYVSEFFTGVHTRAITRYHHAIFIAAKLRGITVNGPIESQWNRDLLTVHVSLLHRQIRVFLIHDLVMRYFVRRYFTKTCNPKFTVYPFETSDERDAERIRFFVWLVNRALVNDGCYEWQTAIDDSEFWRVVLAHCAALSPSTFIAQLFKYVASLDARMPITVHDLLDYVEWLCSYDPWYMCYSNTIVERFRLFSENKLQKQFNAFYESECVLFYVLVGNRLANMSEKIHFLRQRAELRGFANIHHSPYFSHTDSLFDYAGSHTAAPALPSTTIPVFNWFNLSSTLFNYGVYYETLDWCAKTVQDYFAYARTEMTHGRQSSTSSGNTGQSAFRKRPFSSLLDIPPDSLSEMIAKASRSKRQRRSDDDSLAPFADQGSCDAHQDSPGEMNTDSERPSTCESDNEEERLAIRSPRNKRFVVSLLQNCMNFLNDICLLYNGSLIHKCCAENRHNYNQTNFKDRLKQSNDIWKNDKRLAIYHITWKDLDLHKLEASCYREKSEERVSKALGNTLASCSTSQINVNYLRFRHDGKHSYIIFNAMLRRYEIAAPSLMYLLSLDYKNWHLSDNDCYPSTVDTRVRDYVTIALNELDAFVDGVVRIDALSMMLYAEMIREKHIGANNAAIRPDRRTNWHDANTMNDKEKAEDKGTMASAKKRRLIPPEADEETGNVADNQEKIPTWDNETSMNDSSEDKSYVDFIIDRAEFFELSQIIPAPWIYRYFEQLGQGDRDESFIYIVLLTLQVAHNYGIWVIERESFTNMMIEELLLCILPGDALTASRRQKKPTARDGKPRDDMANYPASQRGRPDTLPREDPSATASNQRRCHLSPFLENQFHQCLAASKPMMERYRSSYRRDPSALADSPSSAPFSSANAAAVPPSDEVVWQTTFDSAHDTAAKNQAGTPPSAMARLLFIEQDIQHFFTSSLHSAPFYTWLRRCQSTITLASVVDLGDDIFIRVFAVFVYVMRVIARQQCRLPLTNEKGTALPHSLAEHIMQNAKRVIHELRLSFPCRFVASRGTINLSDAFVDYLERRIITPSCHYRNKPRSGEGAISPAPVESNYPPRQQEEDDDPFMSLLGALSQSDHAAPKLLQSEGYTDDDRIGNIPYLRPSPLPYKTRQSISYFLFFIFIFCNSDMAVTLYMLRFLASLLYPGPWAKTVAIVQGSSNSGKSNMFNLVRSFYNSDMAVLNPKALTGSKDNIGTEFLLMCENFVCQTEELKEVEAETIKTMTSDTPLQARAFHSQRQQTVGILARMVITLNQMFRVVSDEGVLERLRIIFRVTHRHLELVRKESDMTRVNCGASMNVSHQFMRSVFPRGIVPELFQRGMFYTIMHWCPSQVTSPEERFIHADRVAARYLHTLLHADVPSLLSVHELAAQRPLSEVEISQALRRRWQGACVNQETFSLPEPSTLPMAMIKQQMDRRFKQSLSANDCNALLQLVTEPTSRSMITRYVLNVDSFNSLINTTPSRLALRLSHARQYTNCTRLHDQYSYLFAKFRHHSDLVSYLTYTLSASYRASSQQSAIVEQLALPCVNDDEYDDNHVNLMVKPYILDLYLADLHSNIDAFVRFQHTHKITSHESPIRKESLQYDLKVFVDRFNATIPDAKYRVKFNDFFDRFETEYEKFKYRDARTKQIVPNLWAIRVRPLVAS